MPSLQRRASSQQGRRYSPRVMAFANRPNRRDHRESSSGREEGGKDKRSDSALVRMLRKDLMGNRAFHPFSITDFLRAAEIFGHRGYFALAAIRDMDARERDMFLQPANRDYGGRNFLADLRLTLNIFAWFEPHGRMRDAVNANFEGIEIDRRMKSRAVDFSHLANGLVPVQDMVDFALLRSKRGIARPPFAPYAIADSLSAAPWIPADETHAMALVKWQGNHRAFRRKTGNQDMSLGQFILCRMRFIPAWDLADAWADYGGLVPQINQLAVVLDLSITDRPCIAVTYDYRMRRAIQKIAKSRSTKEDYFELLSNLNKNVRADAIRDFEAKTDAIKKDKEKENRRRIKKSRMIRRRNRTPARIRKVRAADGNENGRPRTGLGSGRTS